MEAEKLLARLANCLDPQERSETLEKYGSSVPGELSELIFIHIDIHLAEKNFDLAEELLGIGEEFSRFYNEPFYLYQLYKKKAKIAEEKGDMELVFSIYENLIELSLDIGREDIEAEILMEMGIHYERSGDKEEALARFFKANSIYKRLGHKYNYAASLFNIAYIYYDKGDMETSMDYCQQALDADESETNHNLESHVNLEFANIFETKKEMLLAKVYYQKALEGYQNGNDRVKASDILYKLGGILGQEKRLPQSLEYYQKSLNYKLDIDYSEALAKYYFMRGRILKDFGMTNKAIKLLEKAYHLFQQLGQEKECLKVKFQIYSIYSRFDERIFYLPEFIKNYKTPSSKETTLDKAVKGVYTTRKSDGAKQSHYRENDYKESFQVDRRILSSLLRDLSRAHYMEGDSRKNKFFFKQYKVVNEFKTEKA